MIETIVNFFKTAWDYVTNVISGLVGFVSAFISASDFLNNILAYAPPILGIAISVTLIGFVIKFILGR